MKLFSSSNFCARVYLLIFTWIVTVITHQIFCQKSALLIELSGTCTSLPLNCTIPGREIQLLEISTKTDQNSCTRDNSTKLINVSLIFSVIFSSLKHRANNQGGVQNTWYIRRCIVTKKISDAIVHLEGFEFYVACQKVKKNLCKANNSRVWAIIIGDTRTPSVVTYYGQCFPAVVCALLRTKQFRPHG